MDNSVPFINGRPSPKKREAEPITQAVRYLPNIEEKAIDELLEAGDDQSLRAFTSRHYPFIPTTDEREYGILIERFHFDEQLAVAQDMKGILTFAFGLRSLIDSDRCTEEGLESLGIKLMPLPPDSLCADVHMALRSPKLYEHLRTWEDDYADEDVLTNPDYFDGDPHDPTAYFGPAVVGNKPFYNARATATHMSIRKARERSLQLLAAVGSAGSVDEDESLPILHFHARSNLNDLEDPIVAVATSLLDAMAERLVGHIETRYENCREIQTTKWRFNSFWKLLFQRFDGSRALECFVCGKPMLVSDERGVRRKYCSDACKKKSYRIRKFRSMVEDEHMDEEAAARKVHINLDVAKRCIARHPEEFCATDSM